MSLRSPTLAALMMVSLAGSALAENTDPEDKQAGAAAPAANQGLERQKTMAWLNKKLQEAVPSASINPIPGRGNTIILKGSVENAGEIEKLMKLAQSQKGAFRGEIVDALVVSKTSRVQQIHLVTNFAIVYRARLRREKPELFEKWESLNSRIKNGCILENPEEYRTFLQALVQEGMAKYVDMLCMVGINNRQCCHTTGGLQSVPMKNEVLFVPYGKEVSFMPRVLKDRKISVEIEWKLTQLDPDLRIKADGDVVVHGLIGTELHASYLMDEAQPLALVVPNSHRVKTQLLSCLQGYAGVGSLLQYLSGAFDREEDEVLLVTAHVVR